MVVLNNKFEVTGLVVPIPTLPLESMFIRKHEFGGVLL